MTPPGGDSGDREIELFEAILARPENEWEEFLVRSCGDSPEILARLRARLERERRMRGFLLQPLIPRPARERIFRPGDLAAGRFEIVREIAEGGMAVVYEAIDHKLNRQVALKCPRPEFRRRLPSEVSRALEVTHPGICRLYEIHTGESAGAAVDFFTMEYLDGDTLAQRLRDQSLTREQRLEVARQLCAAVVAAHRQGVVHGDLKPGNVILPRGDQLRAVITDFGLASLMGAPSDGQGPGFSLRATPDYAAPELWKGTPASKASDVFALGVMLAELLTGVRPGKPEDVPRTGLPKKIRAALASCLSEDPAERTRDAQEILAVFEPRPSRAPLWIAAAAVLALATFLGYRQWRLMAVPDVVRLAILSAQTDEAAAAVASGAVYDISDRLRPGEGSGKPLIIIPVRQAKRFRAVSPDSAAKILGATHALLLRWKTVAEGFELEGEISDTTSGYVLRRFRAQFAGRELGRLPSLVTENLASALRREIVLGGGESPRRYREYSEGLHYIREIRNSARAKETLVGAGDPENLLIRLRIAEGDSIDFPRTHAERERAEIADAIARGVASRDPVLMVLAGGIASSAFGPPAAVEVYESAVAATPRYAPAWRGLGEALRDSQQDKEGTLHAFRRAIALEPGYFQAHLNAGVFFYYLGRYKEALGSFEEAARIAPGMALPHRNLGNVLAILGDYARAEREYHEALNIDRDAATLMGLGATLVYQQRDAEAVRYYEQAVQSGPDDILTLIALGDAYWLSGRPDDARRAYARVVDVAKALPDSNPSSSRLRAFGAYAKARLGNSSEALREIATLIRNSPDDVQLRRAALKLYETLGRRKDALDQIRQVPVLLTEIDRQVDFAALRRDPEFVALASQFRTRETKK